MRSIFHRPSEKTVESLKRTVISLMVVLCFLAPNAIAIAALLDSRDARSTTDKGLLLLADAVGDQVEETCKTDEADRDRARAFRLRHPDLFQGEGVLTVPKPRDCDAEADAAELAIQEVLSR